MKKTMAFGVLAIIALLSFACRKNEGPQAPSGAISGEDGGSAAVSGSKITAMY